MKDDGILLNVVSRKEVKELFIKYFDKDFKGKLNELKEKFGIDNTLLILSVFEGNTWIVNLKTICKMFNKDNEKYYDYLVNTSSEEEKINFIKKIDEKYEGRIGPLQLQFGWEVLKIIKIIAGHGKKILSLPKQQKILKQCEEYLDIKKLPEEKLLESQIKLKEKFKNL